MLMRARTQIWDNKESPWFLESNWEALHTLLNASHELREEVWIR